MDVNDKATDSCAKADESMALQTLMQTASSLPFYGCTCMIHNGFDRKFGRRLHFQLI
jgi:hypothetical protein